MIDMARKNSTSRNFKTNLFTEMTSTQMTYSGCFSKIKATLMTYLAEYSCKWDSNNNRGEAIDARIISTSNRCSEGIREPKLSERPEEGSLFQHHSAREVSGNRDKEELNNTNKWWIHQVKMKCKAAAEIKGTKITEIKTKVQTISTIIDNLEESRITLILMKIHLKLLQDRLNKKSKMPVCAF